MVVEVDAKESLLPAGVHAFEGGRYPRPHPVTSSCLAWRSRAWGTTAPCPAGSLLGPFACHHARRMAHGGVRALAGPTGRAGRLRAAAARGGHDRRLRMADPDALLHHVRGPRRTAGARSPLVPGNEPPSHAGELRVASASRIVVVLHLSCQNVGARCSYPPAA